MKKLPVLFAVILLWQCTARDRDACVFVPDVSYDPAALAFEQFEDTIASLNSKDELVAFLGREPMIRDAMFRRQAYPDDSAFTNALHDRLTHPAFDTLLQETRAVFGDGSGLREEFAKAFANLRYYYPDFEPPVIKTLITGLDTDMVVTDSVILVSLDFFLGPDARYRPQTYDYLMRRYDPHDIVPSVMLLYGIDSRLNKTNLNDRTILADMIAYGKSFYFARHMLPCTPDSLLIWYTGEEIEGARENEDLIWARLIEDEVLYATSALTRRAYLGDRPKTLEVGEKCPGRIGQWVGWQIVRAYMERHPDVSLPELMNTADAQQIFKNSNYKPRGG